ncbi:MAG: PAS domain S-box protein [Deltaproteobacteria bacterium]|nr:PAS domain S-box protein [Deltaproteobacteria bacterium]
MNLKHRLPLIAVIFTSVLCIAISVFSLKSGQFIVFQNLFYIPIIISCFYYTKKGFAISVALSCIYFLLIIAFTSDPMIIRDAVIRVCIFIFIAAVITALSMARAHAEAVLKEEREKFRTVADFTYDWEYWTDPQQKLRYISPSCERISGYRPEDFMTDSGLIHSVVHPDDRDIFKCHADHYHELHIDSVGEVNFRIMDRNGEEHWIAHVCRPVYSSDGQFLGRRASNSDITNRKQAEEALREGEHRLHSIIDGSPIPVFVIGKDHRVIYWNKALEELSSIKPEEVVGTHEHWKAFYNEERLCMADLLVDGAVELVPHRYSGKYIKSPLIEDAYEATDFFPALGKDGKWLRFTAAAIRESKGMIVAAVETLEDITERKRAEDAQFKSEERFRITLMSIGDGVITTDAEGRVDLLNPVAENLSGWSQGEARGKQLEEVFSIINEDTRQPVENPVLQVLRDGIVVGLANHTVLIARNGTERPIADSGEKPWMARLREMLPRKSKTGFQSGVVMSARLPPRQAGAKIARNSADCRRRSSSEITSCRAERAADCSRSQSSSMGVSWRVRISEMRPCLFAVIVSPPVWLVDPWRCRGRER